MVDKQDFGTETLQLILDNMHSFVYVTDVENYDVIFANKAIKSAFGENIEGKPCFQMNAPRSGPCDFCRLQEVLQLPVGEPLIWEDPVSTPGRCLNINQTIVKWSDGRKAHIAILSDITDIKANETSLRAYQEELQSLLRDKSESEEMLKSVSDNMPDSFIFQFTSRPERPLEMAYMSKGVEEITGIPVQEITENPLAFTGLFSPEINEYIRTNLRKNTSFTLETPITARGRKEPVWLWYSGKVRKHPTEKEATLVDGLALDITERKKMEQELERSQEEAMHNARLIDEITENMVRTALFRSHMDHDGVLYLDYASGQIENISGFSNEELQKEPMLFSKYVHPEDRERFDERIAAISKILEEDTLEFRYLIDGKTNWYRLTSGGSVKDGLIYRDGVMIDITAQKHLELQLITARDQARESEKLKSSFLANMSHEIRTPMNAIIGFLGVLSEDEEIDRETQSEYMRIVSDNANQLLKLIGDILDISKIDAGQMKIAPSLSNVNVLLHDIRSSFIASGAITPGKQLELIVDESGQDPGGEFTIDAARLRQIVTNIVGNAIKFTDTGHVKFGYQVLPEGLEFYVEDTGIGISKDKLENLGKPFHQLHDARESAKYGGTGIGLAISTNLVKLMGGRFGVQSTLGKGTTFTFTVPCPEIESSLSEKAIA